jgi:thioredoxin reductase
MQMQAMLLPIDDSLAVATAWFGRFEAALHSKDAAELQSLFDTESHWRDMLAFKWNFTSTEGPEMIAANLLLAQSTANAEKFEVAAGRTPPRKVRRYGIEVHEAIFSFETDVGRCNGVLRLPVANPEKAFVFSSSLTELKGHEEAVDRRRPAGSAYSRNFGGANWSDLREAEQGFADRDPTVLIIGGSQFGVTLAARLRLLKVDALVVEKTPRIGDAWRNRYHSLALHNQVGINHFPYIPFPPSWPKYLPKDMLANWIEMYAWAMECNVWTSTTFVKGEFDDKSGTWNAIVRKSDGSERIMRPKHIVFANGVLGAKRTPDVPGLSTFKGKVLHTEDYYSGEAYSGKKVLVMGTGTSAHDTAQDLHGHGADVSMIQRGSSTIVSVEAAGFNNTVHYEENIPIDDADLLGVAATFTLLRRGYQMNVKRMKEHDKELLEGLAAKGFKLDWGPDEAGHQMKLRDRFGGYYLNCGCSELIASGEIGLLQWSDAERLVEDGLQMKDGRVIEADLLVTDKIGPIWGLDAQGEIRNMFGPTPQQGLWFLGGGLSQNRVYSRYLALQIKAQELGLVE